MFVAVHDRKTFASADKNPKPHEGSISFGHVVIGFVYMHVFSAIIQDEKRKS